MNTKERITELLLSTQRDGIEKMVDWLVNEGFFESPASTRYHGAYPGGLADHSLRVFTTLTAVIATHTSLSELSTASLPGQKPLEIKPESIAIAALLHDICKAGAYIGNSAPYKWNKQQPKGHATLSIERIKLHIKLADIEELMIRYHMGVYGLREFYEEGSWEYDTNAEYVLRGDHSKDENMTKEESQKARYGKSLRNAWYHNPIVKVMYFCDGLATLEEKAKED